MNTFIPGLEDSWLFNNKSFPKYPQTDLLNLPLKVLWVEQNGYKYWEECELEVETMFFNLENTVKTKRQRVRKVWLILQRLLHKFVIVGVIRHFISHIHLRFKYINSYIIK
jgi:hypothetical protein